MSCTKKTNSTRKTFCWRCQETEAWPQRHAFLQNTNPTSRDPAWTKQAQWMVLNPSEDLSLHPKPHSKTIISAPGILATIVSVKGTWKKPSTLHALHSKQPSSFVELLRWILAFLKFPFFCCACRCSAVSTRTLSEWSLSQSCRIGSVSAIRSSGNAMPSSSPHKGKHFFRSSVPSIQLPVLSFALQLSGHSGCVSYRTPCTCVSKQSQLWRA